MADTPKYANILDEFLDSREPDWKDLGLKDAKSSGDEWLDRTHGEDDGLLDELAGASKHTNVPPTSKGATLTNRLIDKENAAPRLGSGRATSTRNASHAEDYKSAIGDDNSLLDEVTESLEAAEKSGKVEKKHRSDGEIKNYVKQLLNQGVTPAKVAAQLNKLAEIELFNKSMATRYLQDNAGLVGMAYLEPNTFLDKSNPSYERTASKEWQRGALDPVSKEAAAGAQNLMYQIQFTNGNSSSGSCSSKEECLALINQTIRANPGNFGRPSVQEAWYLGVREPQMGSFPDAQKIYPPSGQDKKASPTPHENGVNELVKRIQQKVKELKADGVVGMSRDNLRQVTNIRGLNFANPNHFYRSFDEAIDKAGVRSFVIPKSAAPQEGHVAAQSSEEANRLMEQQRLGDDYSDDITGRAEDDPRDEYTPDTQENWGKDKRGSQDCVRQAKAWKSAGIKVRAKSVKQISACEGCSYFKKNGGTKSCGLYGLPVVGNTAELSAVVNKMTAGVPAESKRAALVQIANRLPEQNIPKAASIEAPFVRQAAFTKERQYGFVESDHLSGERIQKFHAAGHSLKTICAAAEKKFGALETSKAVREFVASLSKEKGKIIVAKDDADYLNKIGIHNEAIVGAVKCASCKVHKNAVKEFGCKNCEHEMREHKNGKCVHSPKNCKCTSWEKVASTPNGVTRAPDTFVQETPAHVRSTQKQAVASFDSSKVAKLHTAGHSVETIYKAASSKYGSAQASKAIRDWAHNLKNTNTKIALSQIDCTTLKKMGVKLSSQNAIIGAEKCGSCSFRNGMHCGMTGGTLLSFPGMNQITSNKKVASGAPEDGRSMLNEYDLMGKSAQADIDITEPERAEIQMGSKMDAGDI
jgi:hypothetical protein